jgi:hypothetical protein
MNTHAKGLPENVPPVLVIPAQADKPSDTEDPGKPDSARQLVLGLLFGVVFGFLLQKGGVAKYPRAPPAAPVPIKAAPTPSPAAKPPKPARRSRSPRKAAKRGPRQCPSWSG